MTPCYECGLLSTRAPAGATQISALARGLIGKIERAARDMEELIDALLYSVCHATAAQWRACLARSRRVIILRQRHERYEAARRQHPTR